MRESQEGGGGVNFEFALPNGGSRKFSFATEVDRYPHDESFRVIVKVGWTQ